MSTETHILLTLTVPLVGGLGIALAGQKRANLREAVTFMTATALMVLVWSLLPEVLRGGRPELAFAEILPGLGLKFRIEPLGMLFAALASLLWIVNSLYSLGYMRGNRESHQTRFYVLFAVALAAVMGIAFAGNLLTLFLFYEILTLSTYPLVAHKGDARTIASARVYMGILLATSIGLFLPGLIWVYFTTGTLDFIPGGILAGKVSGPAAGLLLVLLTYGVGKAALMPVHRWLPAAMVAPTPVSALLHAVAVVKAGVFTITKIILYIFGVDFLAGIAAADWLLYAAVFTVIMASLVALRQTNLKRMLAYSTIAQLSYIVMAAALFVPAGGLGASLHVVAHAFGKITLFFAAGSIYVAAKKTEIPQLRGIGRRMPWTMAAFSIGALSMIGVPPTAGFVSKWFILGAAFEAGSYLVVFTLVLSTALNAAYFLPILYAAWFLEEDQPAAVDHRESPAPMVVALTLTAALTLLFFAFNQPVLDLLSGIEGASQ